MDESIFYLWNYIFTDEFVFTYSLIGCVAEWLLRLIAYKLWSVADAKFTVSNKL